MTFPAGEVITFARDKHAAFDPRRASDALLVRQLDKSVRDLLAIALRANRRVLTTELVVTLATYDFAAGAVVPDNLYVGNGKAILQSGAECPFTLIDPALQLGRSRPFPCGYIENLTTLKLVGLAVDWSLVASLKIPYVPMPTPITTLASVVNLPLQAKDALAADLAAFMAIRLNAATGVGSIPVTTFREEAAREREKFLDTLGARRAGKVFQVQDGY